MAIGVGRRQFISALGGAAVAWPLATYAQEAGKRPTIGFLGADAAGWRPWTDAFVARLTELGWVDGRTIAIEYRWTEGRPERVAEIAAEFVGRKVDVILSNGPSVTTLKQATAVIPIVFAIAADPIGGGLVTSLAHPGGNVTGQSVQQSDLAGKRLELLREVVPRLRRLAIIVNAGYPSAVLEMDEVQTAARTFGLDVTPLEIRRDEDIAPAFEALGTHVDALYIAQDALTVAYHKRIITLALGARLPTIFGARDFVQAGALMSYGPSFPALFRRAAELVDKILRGTKPGDIPVEQADKFELTVNLTTAKALGLTIPESFLARADEVIE
jgi:putative tryptophan/tyrosine transport system substrate-binding protein